MSNVVSISCTCDYLVKRAARHRRAGRYDEAMALLWKARNQFGLSDEVLFEMAHVYEEIGCEDEAMKMYLRLVRLDGKHKAHALFQLAAWSIQHGDIQRASSYYDYLRSCSMQADTSVSTEMLEVLKQQLHQDAVESVSLNRKKRAKALEKRAASCLQSGRVAAAQRAMEHALRLRETPRGYTMLACCQLIRMRFDDAVTSAQRAHRMSPGNVQTLCVLADAYMACGKRDLALRAIRLASLRARQVDDLLSVAVESAKVGEDVLTCRLTDRILQIAPFHTRAMMLQACAYINRRDDEPAKRLLGRLCGLLPENSVCESYFHSVRDEATFSERMTLGLDVTREEGILRASELVSMLYMDPKALDEDRMLCIRICRLADWAFHSPMAGAPTKTVALALLASLQADEARSVLLDLLMHPQISDSLKLHALQILTAKEGFYPYYVDMGGKLVRLAAGGVSERPAAGNSMNSKIVQRVADELSGRDQNAASALLSAFLAYLNAYGHPDSKHENACAAALEYWYVRQSGKLVKDDVIAQRYGVSVRLMHQYVRRFDSCMNQ